jgi:hypothetical protein
VEPSADAGLAEFRCLGASRTDVGPKAREQHAWAATHIKAGLGGTRVDLLDRDDVAGWLDDLAECGELARPAAASRSAARSCGRCSTTPSRSACCAATPLLGRGCLGR